MRKLVILLFVSACFLQVQAVESPEHIVIVGDRIITMEELREIDPNSIKEMMLGVTGYRRAELVEQFGDKLPPGGFIFEIILHTEEEMEERRRQEEFMEVATRIVEQHTALHLSENALAIDFTVQMINGETVTLSDLRGQVVLLNFGSVYCAPCMRKFYALPSAILEPFENSAFVFLPILIDTMDCAKERMARFREVGIDFNVGIDTNRSIFNQYARGGIPIAFLIDKNGVIRYVSRGFSEQGLNELATMIQELLDEEFEQETAGNWTRIAVFAFLLVFVVGMVLRKMRKK